MRRSILLAAPLAALVALVAIAVWPRRPAPGPAISAPDGGDPAGTGAVQDPGPGPQTPKPTEPDRPGSLKVLVTGSAGPVADAVVRIVREPDHQSAEKTTALSGQALFEGLQAGEWFVGVRHRAYVPGSERVRVEEGRAAEVVLRLVEGGRAEGIVTGPQGQPMAGATVRILDNERKTELDRALSALTDERGHYLIEGIPLQKVGMQARAARCRPVERYGVTFSQPGETQIQDFALAEGTSVSGRVIDEAGAPIAGATVKAGNEFASVVQTDAEGRFAIYELGDNPVALFASAKGFGTEYLRNVAPNSSGVEFRLFRAGRLEGHVTPAVEDFSLLLYRFEQDLGKELLVRTARYRNARAGEFVLTDVARGVYELAIEAPGCETVARTKVVVNPGETVTGIMIGVRSRP